LAQLLDAAQHILLEPARAPLRPGDVVLKGGRIALLVSAQPLVNRAPADPQPIGYLPNVFALF